MAVVPPLASERGSTGERERQPPLGRKIRFSVTENSVDVIPGTGVAAPLHNSRACRHALDFAHVAMVYGGHMAIVPGNRDRVPTYFGDMAAIIGMAAPINAAALLETLSVCPKTY